MKPRSAIKTDLFADEHHRKKIDTLGDPLAEIESYIDFVALAAEVDRIAPRPVSAQGGRPPYPTETMVRILVLKRLYNLSDEQMEYQLLDRMSYKRFCGLANATNIPDRTTVWTFENRIGEAGAKALFDGVSAQLLKKGFIARGGQIIDATLVPAPKQHNSRGEKALIDQGARLVDACRGLAQIQVLCQRRAHQAVKDGVVQRGPPAGQVRGLRFARQRQGPAVADVHRRRLAVVGAHGRTGGQQHAGQGQRERAQAPGRWLRSGHARGKVTDFGFHCRRPRTNTVAIVSVARAMTANGQRLARMSPGGMALRKLPSTMMRKWVSGMA